MLMETKREIAEDSRCDGNANFNNRSTILCSDTSLPSFGELNPGLSGCTALTANYIRHISIFVALHIEKLCPSRDTSHDLQGVPYVHDRDILSLIQEGLSAQPSSR